MPKLKALSKDEDIAAVPFDQPVLVDLDPGGVVETDDNETNQAAGKAKDEDAGVNVLKEQLAALQEANRLSEERRLASERRAQAAERERDTAVTSQSRTEEDAVQSGLSAAQAEQQAAKLALKQAGEAGDWEAVGEANARIGRAASDIREFERAASTLADRKEQEKNEPQRQPVQQTTDINSRIDSNSQLLPAERVWLKAHPEALIDPSRNKELDVAYIKATRQGISRGTDAYFKFIEQEMGYSKTQAKEEDDDMSVSAPVSRNERGSDGKPSNGKIMLSPEQREIAKSMGVSETDYARQVQVLEQRRREDPERYR